MKINLTKLSTALLLCQFLACTDQSPKLEEPVTAYQPAPDRNAQYEMDEIADTEGDYDSADMAAEAPSSPSVGQYPKESMSADPKWNTERYRSIEEQGFKSSKVSPLSTFAIDVDTAGYSIVRSYLTRGQMPPTGAVRIEEMLNYFDYKYPGPQGNDAFAIHTTVGSAPWDENHRLVRIGIKGREIPVAETPAINLVFLLDVSGSMEDANKLPLLKRSLSLLVKKMRPIDSVAIVVYAGASGVVLNPTSDHGQILEALDHLQAGGSTNGGEGIRAAYNLAEQNFKEDGINRVILATDGDFNVGVTSESELVKLIEKKAESGVFLSVLGFGSGNYNDSSMEQLADKGNGNYAYIDTIDEARKVLVQQMSGTLVTIAKDVKIQVEFNPDVVESYRLIGYENRAMAAEDFNDDKKDAGEIGAGHTVTALYEVVMKGSPQKNKPSVDNLRYQSTKSSGKGSGELLTVKVRYKQPQGTKSTLVAQNVPNQVTPLEETDADFRFASAVAGFGMKLRGSKLAPGLSYEAIINLGKSSLHDDQYGFRSEFLSLVRKAESLDAHH